ncbi:MAG: DNA replication/repair protein RecF [Thermoclostridium sp.]|nr:DNA replication/repair protein RecF [Thermoclostridium sp.]
MVIKKLQLKNFRNYIEEEVVFSENISLIYGENAQGKTNIVEALYLFATGKSHRTKNINELIRYGESFFDIILYFEEDNYEQTLELRYEKGKGKLLLINEVKKDRISDLLGVVPSVLFAPESLLTVKGSPGDRRKILDIVLCQMNRTYLSNLQKYNKIIKNKNILLRELQVRNQHYPQLEVWSEGQARTGSYIICERKELIRSLEKRMNRLLYGISEGKEKIQLKYKTFEDEGKQINEALVETIKRNINREIDQGNCLIGPHRDDMEIYVNQRNSRMYCSQGQQRSVALAMNIAILEELEEKMGKPPILLLDDVMSELDEKRQKYLFDVIDKRQTIITTTEKSKFEKPGEKVISYIQVKDGKILGIT